MEAILATLESAKESPRRQAVRDRRRNHQGQGRFLHGDQAGWHGKAPNAEQTEQALAELTANKEAK